MVEAFLKIYFCDKSCLTEGKFLVFANNCNHNSRETFKKYVDFWMLYFLNCASEEKKCFIDTYEKASNNEHPNGRGIDTTTTNNNNGNTNKKKKKKRIVLRVVSSIWPMVLLLNVIKFCDNFYISPTHVSSVTTLGRAMVLGSFQYRGVLLLWHVIGQGPAVLAAGAGRVGYFSFFHLVYPIFLF